MTIDTRSEPRDPVDFRTRATTGDGRSVNLQVVNMSAGGLMARCEAPLAVGERLRVTMPVLGSVHADVRWSLGGRIGCQLAQTVAPAAYYGLLAAMVRR